MPNVCGADGCKAGWFGVYCDLESRELSWRIEPDLNGLFLRPVRPSVLAVDVPIGLPASGARACDLNARLILGARASSVFPAPIRGVLPAGSHAEASAIRREAEGKGMSIQAWAIVSKVRQVDEALRGTAELRAVVREVHPEVCFYFMAGRVPLLHSKKTAAGKAERLSLLRAHFGRAVDRMLSERPRKDCAADDVIDAAAATWTALRIAAGEEVVLPSLVPRDSYGLPMEMVA